jgi:NAD(P)-dependent dehydrogenase (short-subunit alcohol dehydrogenase family)
VEAIMQVKSKTVLVTGSTDGVGRHVAKELGRQGAHVLIHGRDASRGKDVVEEIRGSGGKADFYRADFASLDEVRGLAEAIRKDHERLHLLINNAGIGTRSSGSQRRTSVDGHELRFAVNYLSGFLLTHLLLPLLRDSAPARIVNVASAGQAPIDFDDVMLAKHYDGGQAYCQSKLAQIMFTFDLAEQLKGTRVTANCLHPATYMATTMVREAGVTPTSTVEEGGAAILKLATSPELEGRTGLYFDRTREARAHPQAYDKDARTRLRKLSLELTGLPD